MNKPLMPKATAVWLIENTALTFDQIAIFCDLHPLEIKGIADGEVASGIAPMDPLSNGQLTREEISRCENDPSTNLRLSEKARKFIFVESKKKAKYIPVARRSDKPDAISWLLKNIPNINDNQIVKLIGTTKNTIEAIRTRSHWNIANIKPRDPVLLGLCKQIELDKVVEKNKLSDDKAAKQQEK